MIDYSDEQINRDIAEWCKIKPKEVATSIASDRVWTTELQYPNFLDEIQGLGLLFKYAVPKLKGYRLTSLCSSQGVIHYAEADSGHVFDTSPTRALALSIHKLIKEAE